MIIKQDFGEIISGGAPVLLWTNPNPNNVREAFTISDIPEYDNYIVLTKFYYDSGYSSQGYVFNFLPNYDVSSYCSEGGGYYKGLLSVSDNSSDPRFPSVLNGGRILSYSNGTISIGNCNVGKYYDIPLKIWGINGELPF